MKSITITHMGRDMKIGRNEFVKRWVNTISRSEIFMLDPCEMWLDEIKGWQDQVAEKAGNEWDRLYSQQHGGLS